MLKPPQESLAHLVMVENPEHHPGGDFGIDAGGRLHASPGRLTYSGISVIDLRLFEGCEQGTFPLKPLLERAMDAGRLTGQRHAGAWTDVGTPARLAALDSELRLGKLKHSILSSPVG